MRGGREAYEERMFFILTRSNAC